jgi:hypothetical protein
MTTTNIHSRVLVLANEVADSAALRQAIAASVPRASQTDVLIVAPALNTSLRHWLSDDDAARDAARDRLLRSVARLERDDIVVNAMIGDPDPLQAAEDALRLFPADAIVVVSRPPASAGRRERRMVERLGARSRLPIRHLVAREHPRSIRRPPGLARVWRTGAEGVSLR